MKILVGKNYDRVSEMTANIIATKVKEKPDAVLGLATGGTPKGVYKRLIAMYNDKKIDFSKVKTFNLDEYYGLSSNHPQSYAYYMKTNFFDYINIKEENAHIPDGLAQDIDEECHRYEQAIKDCGGIDLQLLGIGHNGHIGFNEPDDALHTSTHLVNLHEKTISANSRFFGKDEEVPRQAITMGIGSIFGADEIVLIASGEDKAEIIAKMINGQLSSKLPASMLQIHKSLTIIIDEPIQKHLYAEGVLKEQLKVV
ncbi:glucosamine-6-phosphate deaminase [Proteinivorax tanatarense]|uniref:Glucosamine-6-phosphate deaminase n=1 Tax=Proteinivorax tanatarense TaxID=1260629 RepID=A0AAU7VMZ3_9FIRM